MSETTTTAKPTFKSKILKRLLPTFLIAFSIPFIICICIPIEIFGNNLDEFLFAFSGFIGFNLLFTFLFTLVIFSALLFLPNKAYRITSAVIISLAFLFFLQGTFLNGSLSSLSGDALGDEVVSTSKKVFNIIIWIVIIAGAVVLSLLKDKNGIIALVGLLLCGIVMITQFISPLTVCMSTEGVFSSRENRKDENGNVVTTKILTEENLNSISSTNNVFFFCVDRFDQEYAQRAHEECPEIFESLKGFTAFDDNISLYGHTYPAVVNLLTGKRLNPNESREKFLSHAFKNNQTLDVLNKEGYKINLFTVPYYTYSDAVYMPEYVDNVTDAASFEVTNKPILSLSMMQIALYRCAPLVFKDFLGNINSGTCNSYVESEGVDGNSQFSADMKGVYNYITENEFKTTEEKQFSFIHVDGCHSVLYDEEWNTLKLTDNKDIMLSVKNSFAIINVYLEQLKKAGVYDDATIIITGDHATPINDRTELPQQSLTALYFKPSGSSSDNLKFSSAPVSHDDIWNTIFSSEKIERNNSNKTLFEYSVNDNREREYFWHTYVSPMREYVYQINGSGKDFNNWKINQNKSGTYYKFIMD